MFITSWPLSMKVGCIKWQTSYEIKVVMFMCRPIWVMEKEFFQSDKIKNIQDFYLNDERDLDLLKHSHCTKELEKKYQTSRERVSMYDHLSELKTDLKNIADHSDLPIIIAGFSMGGLLALALAESRINKRIKKLLMISPALRVNIPEGKGWAKIFTSLLNGGVQLLHEMRYRNFPWYKLVR